jgi:acetate kinase
MGFTPLAGVLMGTRCGDIDPAIVTTVMDKEKLSTADMDALMNKKSGVLGISGVSSDFRDLGEAAEKGNKRAQLALDMFHYQVRKEIGAFAAAMGGVDVITFTAGVGENGIEDRAAICKGLEYLGAKLDPKRNDVRGKDALISTDDSTVKLYVIPTNEEIMIARDTKDIVSK